MLAGVIEVDDLDPTGKMKFRQIPDPFGPVAHDHLLFGATPACGRCNECSKSAGPALRDL
jgi:hypothetical protein